MSAEGQVHGGIAHGIGNALFEFMRCDDEGQPQATAFAGYLPPTSTEIPPLEPSFFASPSPANRPGVKGIGAAGTVRAASRIASAIDDALKDFGVEVSALSVHPVHPAGQIDTGRPAAVRGTHRATRTAVL